jgi:NAD(P)-dependent dehydrogenase (short-subunit alcohol dehydrogenase family)
MGWLEGKVALITGGGSGIGRGAVETFVAEGAKVTVLEYSPAKVDDLRAKLGQGVHLFQGDATRLEDNLAAVSETLAAFGQLDILATFPGVFDSYISLLDFPGDKLSAAFDELFGVNVKSYLLSAKAALPELLKTNGCMVFTASNAAFYPDGGGCLYTASKFAVRGLITQLAHELAPRVRVNGVAPGGTRTDIRGLKTLGMDDAVYAKMPPERKLGASAPLQEEGTPADHSWAYLYLASSERSRMVTGTIIHSDGGLGVRGIRRLAGMV